MPFQKTSNHNWIYNEYLSTHHFVCPLKNQIFLCQQSNIPSKQGPVIYIFTKFLLYSKFKQTAFY